MYGYGWMDGQMYKPCYRDAKMHLVKEIKKYLTKRQKISDKYSMRIKELVNWREAISRKRLGFREKFFTTICTYWSSVLFKVLERFRKLYFFFWKKFFFGFLAILAIPVKLEKNSWMCKWMRLIYTNFFFCWVFSDNFCGFGT